MDPKADHRNHNRAILASIQAGEKLSNIARAHGISTPRVHQIRFITKRDEAIRERLRRGQTAKLIAADYALSEKRVSQIGLAGGVVL